MLPNKPNVTSRRSDCSYFQATTVYTNFDYNPFSTVSKTAVPSYVSACSTPGSPQQAFASACSCWSVPAATVTAEVTGPCVYFTTHSCTESVDHVCVCPPDPAGDLMRFANDAISSCTEQSQCPAGYYCITPNDGCFEVVDISICQ